MKIPYIKVGYEEEQTEALGKMCPSLVVGFGLHWAWIYIFIMSSQNIIFFDNSENHALFLISTGIAHGLTLFSYAIFLEQARAIFSTSNRIKSIRLIGAVLMCLSPLLCVLGGYFPVEVHRFILLIAGCSGGVGSAILLMSFGVSFSTCDLPTIALCTALSIPIGALVFSFTYFISTYSMVPCLILYLLLPLFELLCINNCSMKLTDKLQFSKFTMPVKLSKFGLLIGFPCAIFGFLLGILRSCALVGFVQTQAQQFAGTAISWSAIVASTFACVCLIIAMVTMRKSRNFAFRMLIPLIAVLLALLCFHWDQNIFVQNCSLFGSYFMLEMALWVMLSDISQTYRITPFTTFGIGFGAVSLTSTMSFSFIQADGILQNVFVSPELLATIALVTLTFGVAVLPNSAEIRSTFLRGTYCPSFNDSYDFENPLAQKQATALNLERVFREGNSSDNVLSFNVLESNDIENVIPNDSFGDEKGALLGEQEIIANYDYQQNANTDAKLGRFKRKCVAVADTFLLSRRETEILFLLAKGKNSSSIQETLYISAGTANTHMRNIYRKLDIHSHSELIKLVESMEND